MRQRRFGKTGVEVAVLGQGTWQLRDKRQAAATLKEGVRLGMTHIDTAELYTGSEEVIRGAIMDRRRDLFVASKVLPHNAGYEGTLAACEKSLARLGADRLDLYYLHWWSDDFPIEDTMRAMAELVDRGKVRFVGVSNFDVPELEEARAALGNRHLAANQVLYALNARGAESEVIPWCRAHGVAVVGYSPFRAGWKETKVLREVADDVGRTPRQVTLSFLTRDENVFGIPKAETMAHVRENSGGDFDLPKDAIDRLDKAFPVSGGLPML